MQVSIELRVDDLAATRFAMSPLGETVSGLQLLALSPRYAPLREWARQTRRDIDRAGLRLPTAWPLLLTGRDSFPEFLLPAPDALESTIDHELDRLRRTRAAAVRVSLRRVFGEDPPPEARELAGRPAAVLRTVAAELRAAHDVVVAPHWDRIRAVLAADIAHRARQLAAGGADRLFADLHSDIAWRDGRLQLHHRDASSDARLIRLGERGLVLVPSVLLGGQVRIKRSTSTQTVLRYPARGQAALGSTAGPPGRSAVQLLGRGRAAVLAATRSPATTGSIARLLDVTPSAVSQQLSVLRASGLVSSDRAGRTVVHLASEVGLAVLDPR